MPRHLPSQRTRQCEETSGRLACDVRGKQAPLHCNIEPVTDVRSSRYSRNFSCQGNSSVTMLINMIALKIRATTLEEINCCQFRKLVQRSRSIHHTASMCTPQYTTTHSHAKKPASVQIIGLAPQADYHWLVS
ncbi:uncharacterized protein PADG_06146 [Paracoccidioides brasiliensis Pb18]|uniref:Uncharacterized protein n=1 Tax=Paracoccidioides brasiliensis (strain Pb18) TaxID=502780 RepID=C1GFW0_PARBD|nr:uncharacterized protein PADG_06146 [Paracoccidioides brasiliensis Pb18]EEH50067.2 hypothetical protein PADG_06146 [Paracoccidioides brasiliensis Pb18]